MNKIEELLLAIEKDNLVKMRSLLESGVNLHKMIVIGEEYDMDEPDETPLLFYAIRNYASLEAIELLLEYGLDINESDETGISTLDTAIKFKRHDIIELCISKGMDVNDSRRKSGITAIMLASCFSDTTTIELLLKHGANINATDKYGMSPKDYARKLGQKRMQEFLTEKGGEFSVYREE